jgi:hypothetical protein
MGLEERRLRGGERRGEGRCGRRRDLGGKMRLDVMAGDI